MQSVFQTSPLTPIALYRPTLDTAVASETQDRPQLEVSIDVSHSCHPLPLSSLPGTPPGHGMVTPSPTSASAYSNSPASTYSHPVTPLLYGRCPTGSPPESASPLEADILPSMPGPSRRQGRRSSLPSSPLDDGLVIQGTNIVHPYARLYNKKNGAGKRRKMWNHALEKALFTPEEISTMGAPQRRTIYTASLEAHIDRLHDQLAARGMPVATESELLSYHGLNAKTAKSMVSGLHHDASDIKVKLLEIERANSKLEQQLGTPYK